MREFFGGWRRKVGCVTLVMAVLFTASWVRSYFSHDGVAFPMFARKHTVHARKAEIRVLSHDPLGRAGAYAWSDAIAPDVELDFGTLPDSYRATHRTYAHWALVLPLTLLSAYLILWKPRPPPPAKPADLVDCRDRPRGGCSS